MQRDLIVLQLTVQDNMLHRTCHGKRLGDSPQGLALAGSQLIRPEDTHNTHTFRNRAGGGGRKGPGT